MNTRRMFECVEGSSSKFWEVWAEGKTVFTRFGKLGASGQTKVKQEADPRGAIAKLIAEKVGKGYRETTAGEGGAADAPELDAKELRRHLAALPPLVDDPAYLVFADWLQTQDHPWGQLIALQHGLATNAKKAAALHKEVDKLLAIDGAAILGPLARAKGSRWTWHLGFLRRAEVACRARSDDIAAAVKALLALPAAHMLETLVIAPVVAEFHTWRAWESSLDKVVAPWALDKLKKLVPARITRLGFGGWPAPPAAAYVAMPSFGALSKAFPNLTHLEMTGHCGDDPGRLALPSLVELTLRFSRATAGALQAVATSKLPKLERLEVWLGGESRVCVDQVHNAADWEEDQEWADRYPETFSAADLAKMSPQFGIEASADTAALRPLLAASYGPALSHLTVGGPTADEYILEAVLKSPLVKRLKVLDVKDCVASEAKLIAAKKSLAHLDSLIVAEASKKLLAALPNTKVVPIEEDDENAFHFRFVATVE